MNAPSENSVQNAVQPDASAWVGANAGAGKTYILVSRLVRLMLSGVAPEKLLCLTYTRSAAAEMQERLFDLLGEWALLGDDALRAAIIKRLGDDVGLDDLQKARILFARALETPGGLRVQTIHAFCESLLKRFPLEAGLSPQFDLMDESDMQDMQIELISALLRRPPNERLRAAMGLLSRALSEPDLVRLGRQVLDHRAAFADMDKDAHLQNLAQKTGLTIAAGAVPEAARLMADARAHIAPHIDALATWLDDGSKTDKARGQALRAWRAAAEENGDETAQWALLQPIFLTEGRLRKSLATKKISEAVPQMARLMHQLGETVEDIALRLRARSTYDLSAALLHFADALLSDYAHAKAARAVLDYDDLIATTNRLLSGHRAAQWVLFKIDSGLEHILVDEAQDTSPAQWRLIRALADEFFTGQGGHDAVRTLFAVGDEKQSIFSFQGADPREFEKQRAHFNEAVTAVGGRFHYVPLTLSWRSVPHVLGLVDAVFADEGARLGVSVAPVAHQAHRETDIGYVELWPVERPPAKAPQIDLWALPETATADMMADSAAGRLAARIGDKIAALLADEKQNVSAGDILILVRKRDGFVDEMIRVLKRRRIQVAGADRMVLLDQIVIMDILAAADFALNCDDDLTLACLLRSPLCGVDETTLFKLAHGRDGTLWQAFQAQAARAENTAALQKAHQRLLWMRNRIDFLSPFDWLSELLAAQGGHAALRAQLGAEIDDPVGELLRLALAYESRHVASMQGFLHWLRHGQQEIKRDMEGRGGAVRIMTVHGAKGLEAPIVFLPDTCRPAVKTGGGAEALQFDEDGLPFWRASKKLRETYGAKRVEAAAQDAAEEEKRLLYVALTRARDRLYIGGFLGKKSAKLPVNCWYERLAAAFDAPSEMTETIIWSGGEEAPLPQAEEADEGARRAAPSPAAAPDWLRQAPAKEDKRTYLGAKLFAPSALGEHDMSAPQGANLDAAVLQAAAQRGRLAHRLLETLPAIAAEERRAAALSFLARQETGGTEYDAAAAEQLIDEVFAVMQAPDMAALFAPAARAEAPIAGVLRMDDGSRLALAGQIDRYVETDTNTLLVDFKTGHRPDAVPPAYMVQMAAYRALMQAAKPEKPVRCALVWTRMNQIEWLDDAELDAYLADILSGRRRPA